MYVEKPPHTYIHILTHTQFLKHEWNFTINTVLYQFTFQPLCKRVPFFLTHSCWNLDIINIVNIINLMGGNISLFNLHFPAFSKIEQILTYSVATDILFFCQFSLNKLCPFLWVCLPCSYWFAELFVFYWSSYLVIHAADVLSDSIASL